MVLRGLFDRECLGSTGIGRGVATPHALLGTISSPVVSAWPSPLTSTASTTTSRSHLACTLAELC
ncbi:PTS sugar transporter subunit IIA [Mesorhizobium sp. M0437]